jgi:hypothetical protein
MSVSENNRNQKKKQTVAGLNSMAAYLIAHLCEEFIVSSFHTHIGNGPFMLLGPGLEPLLLGIVVMLTFWLMLFWMYRKNSLSGTDRRRESIFSIRQPQCACSTSHYPAYFAVIELKSVNRPVPFRPLGWIGTW